MIKTVIFDIDNTLYSYDDAHEVAFAALKEYVHNNLGLSAEEFEKLHKETMHELNDRMGKVAATHNRVIRYQTILEKIGAPLYPHLLAMYELYWNTLIEASVPSKGTEKLFLYLKSEGIRIGIGTDMTTRIQIKKLEHLGLLQYIDFVVSSEEAVAEKPSYELFALCLKKAGCKPQECIFVGDNWDKDVEGAKNAGMHAVHFVPKEKGDERKDNQISDMEELIGLTKTL